ncbi:STAS domain-containing protein [uncultured Campylobacter sp.]|uniref:STAS domain-containing protein n=1 Tax=uncultured Campylobacter sp. TaxID=218934 RepID=UPI0026382D7F|nr:STAS domain-containing protein [uncultured Campylobacter sp.]
MRLDFKDDVAIFYPSGFLDGDIDKYEISDANIKYLRQKAPRHILISLKNTVYFNKVGFNLILESVSRITKENDADIGFCDYNEIKFKALKRMSKDVLNLSFFETLSVALLFWGKFESENKQIIVFNADTEQKRQIALTLSGRGYKPVIAKDEEEFNRLHKDFECAIRLTDIKSNKKELSTTLKENVVVYEINGFIDSEFADKFAYKSFLQSLKIGFKFFVFDMKKSSFINIHGVSFLAKLAMECADSGATIAMCGLKKSNVSKALLHDLEDCGILLYDTIQDFFNDDATIEGGGSIEDEKPKNITKELIDLLPDILKVVMDTLASLSNLPISRKSTEITNFSCDEEKFCMGSVAFYGETNAKFILCVEKNAVYKICKILLQEGSDASMIEAYADLLSVISDRIEAWLKSQKIEANFTLPHVFEEIKDEDKKNKGALVRLDIDGMDAIFFLSK